jgi:peptide/nickel transport system substrate-binding protein
MRKSNRTLAMIMVVVGLALIIGLTWGVAGSFGASNSPAPSTEKVVLKIGWQTDPDNLNPFIGAEESAYEIWALNYDFLFGFSNKDESTPQLAAEIPTYANGGISADGKVWTIKIRPNVKWNDGVPLTADDVAFTYNDIIDNQLYAFASMTDGIKEVKVVDPTTVQIICDHPKADILRLWIPIVPEHIWGKMDAHTTQRVFANKPPIVGSGPFYVTKFDKGNQVVMDRNPYYWGQHTAVDQVVFLDYTSADAMTQELKAGAIDACHGIPPAQFDGLSKTKGLEAIAFNYLNWDYLCMNCYTGPSTGNPVLLDPAFRKALNYAIDQQQIINLAFNGRAVPGVGIMPTDSWENPDYHWTPTPDQLYTFDPE